MIKEVTLKNFLSFQKETFFFNKAQNIMIGINGSGKSNFIKAIRLLKEGVSGLGLKKFVIDKLGGYDNIHFKSSEIKGGQSFISLEFVFDCEILRSFGFKFLDDLRYKIDLFKSPSTSNYYVREEIKNSKGFVYLDFENGVGALNELDKAETNYKKTKPVKYHDFIEPTELALSKVFDTDRYFVLSTIRKAINEIQVYDYFDTTPGSNIRKPMLPTSEKILLPDGTNLPQILNTIKINSKPSYQKIASMLNEVNPKFRGFDFNFIGGNIELMLEEENLDSSIHVSSISDGTLRFLCLLSIIFNPERGKVICIDEPEVGLHPDMIANVGRGIIEASKMSTMLISTHSENLLNCFEFENIRVFEKDESNSSKISSYEKKDFQGWYEEYSIGKMWRNGDLGGNRW